MATSNTLDTLAYTTLLTTLLRRSLVEYRSTKRWINTRVTTSLRVNTARVPMTAVSCTLADELVALLAN
jgi:hypothetical protein